MSERKNAGKTQRGKPFEPGNPGKPKGAKHKITRAIEELLAGEHEAITRKAIEKAKEGDIAALRLCIERLAPARKDAPISFVMPPIRTAADALDASAAVLSAVADGEITPSEGAAVMGLLVSHKVIVEASDLEHRIAALEEAKGK